MNGCVTQVKMAFRVAPCVWGRTVAMAVAQAMYWFLTKESVNVVNCVLGLLFLIFLFQTVHAFMKDRRIIVDCEDGKTREFRVEADVFRVGQQVQLKRMGDHRVIRHRRTDTHSESGYGLAPTSVL